MIIAQRFIAGLAAASESSPVGTAECPLQPSLRDCPIVSALRPAMNRWAISKRP